MRTTSQFLAASLLMTAGGIAQADGTWGLPLLAETARSRGVELPSPVGIGLMYVNYREDLILEDFVIEADTGQRGGIDFVELSDGELETNLLNLRVDAWLFPFMNVYAAVGTVDNEVQTGYSFTGEDVANFIGDGEACAAGADPRPELCDRTFNGQRVSEPEGTSYSLGTVLALGRGPWFALAGFNYTWNDVDTVDTTMETLAISPRIGRRVDLGANGNLQLYAGGLYLDSDIRLTERYVIPGPDGEITISITAEENNAEAWSYVAGGNWDLTRHWSLLAELGYGSAREGMVAALLWRF